MDCGAIVEMQQLVLPSSGDPYDSAVTQSSRCRVGKLSGDGGMKRLRSRDRLAFDCSAQSLHRFFHLRQLWHRTPAVMKRGLA